MKKLSIILPLLVVLAAACGGTEKTDEAKDEPKAAVKEGDEKGTDVKKEAEEFLSEYQADLAKLEKEVNLAWWDASITGSKESFEKSAAAQLELKKLHSDKDKYAKIVELLKSKGELEPLTVRALEVAELAFKGNQLPEDVLEELVKASTEVEEIFNTFRPEVNGEKRSDNDLKELMGKETDTAKRKEIWEGLKQVGGVVGPKLVALAKIRNKAARTLGYENFWDMQVRLQEHDPAELLAIFDELEKATDEPFKKMKAELDGELSKRFGIKPEEMMPWHYDNPFFQDAPPSDKVNLDEFYKDKSKEDIMALAVKFYQDIGLPCDDVVKRSDLYEKEGKSQHAFCISIDRGDDVRTLLNIKPTVDWMDTSLHEEGHAVYYVGIDKSLPYNLREAAHIFTTEAVAMLFGALGKNPTWMVGYAGADEKRVDEVKDAILEQRRREQLIFARWTMVMLHFEKALYENPDQDLNKLWWDTVAKYQGLTPPEGRTEPDWASKPHFAVAPVYYHNYMLGEVFAAQLRHTLAKMAKHEGPTNTLSFNNRKDFGEFLSEKVFKPGMAKPWPEFVKDATAEPLTAKYFGEEVQ